MAVYGHLFPLYFARKVCFSCVTFVLSMDVIGAPSARSMVHMGISQNPGKLQSLLQFSAMKGQCWPSPWSSVYGQILRPTP